MRLSTALPVAVVGGGVAGLACAHSLTTAGLTVEIFDKGRAPGGRVCTRHTEFEETFDHGAQFVTARDPGFQAWLDGALTRGEACDFSSQIQRLQPSHSRLYLGQPTMSRLAQALATGLQARCSARVASLVRGGEIWHVELDDGTRHGPYAAIVVAVPAPQAVALLEPVAPALARQAASAQMAPCWTVMATWDAPLGLNFSAREISHPLLAWAACEARKPGRGKAEAWVLQASAEWSQAHLEAHGEDIIPAVLDAFTEVTGQAVPPPLRARAHRWRYARVTHPVGVDSLYDPTLQLAACGDWCRGNRVEDAWLSGRHAAQALVSGLAVTGD